MECLSLYKPCRALHSLQQHHLVVPILKDICVSSCRARALRDLVLFSRVCKMELNVSHYVMLMLPRTLLYSFGVTKGRPECYTEFAQNGSTYRANSYEKVALQAYQ